MHCTQVLGLQQADHYVRLPEAEAVRDRHPDQVLVGYAGRVFGRGHDELPALYPDLDGVLHADIITALSIIATVFESTAFHSYGIVSLTKTSPGTCDLLRYSSTYVDLPNVETTSALEDLAAFLDLIVIRSRPTPDLGMVSWTNPQPNIFTPLFLSMLIVEMWYEMLNENTAGMPIVLITLVSIALLMKSSVLHLAHNTTERLFEIERTCTLKLVPKS
ncbi:MAG: hypothetical protein LQ346_008666 [Caloplaca aetnensis]|nr:MAG: hypothetical protein LQ346_008666 [Caloplaca aetnensis]